jgi:flagellar hook-associated protein 1 FlgK
LADPSISVAENATSEGLGFKISDYLVTLAGDKLETLRTDGQSVAVTRSATSPVAEKYTLSNLPNEDLIVLVTGNGSRLLSASFDAKPETTGDVIKNFSVKMISSAARTVEIFDKDTGHSIANRVLDADDLTEAVGYQLGFTGRGKDGDTFHIEENKGAVGDGRNILEIASLQRPIAGKNSSSGFQQMFNDIVTSVGASLRANETSLDASEAIMEASIEAESAYSGISLDTEAARLIEQQQAYQASARVLQTARELFQTLMDVV